MMPPQGGGMQAAGIEAVVGADTSQAESAVQNLGRNLTAAGDAAGGKNLTGFQRFGQGTYRAMQTGEGGVRSLARAMGQESIFGPMLAGLQSSMMGFQRLSREEGVATTGLERFARAGRGLAAVGSVVMGIGAALTAIGAPLARANADLETAVGNTKNSVTGSANSLSDFEDRIDSADKTGARFGFSMAAVNQALAKLTVQTKDPNEALKELTLTETLAAATGRTLGQAADVVGRMHAGQFRYLRQFGIHIANTTNYEKMAERAAKDLASAQERLGNATLKLTEFQERLAARQQKSKDDWAEKVNAANDSAADADQRYADLQERLTSKEEEILTTHTDAVSRASEQEAKARQNLADLQANLAAEAIDQAEAKAEAEENASRTVEDAVRRMAEVHSRQELNPAKSGREQAEQRLAMQDAARGIAEAREKLDDVQNKPLQNREQTLQDSQRMRDAIAATEQEAEAVKKAEDKKQVAIGETIAQRQQLANAEEAAADAHKRADKVSTEAATAGDVTIAERQMGERLERAVAKEKADIDKAKAMAEEAAKGEILTQERFNQAVEEFMGREKGLLERREKTWAGHVAKLRANLENELQRLGEDPSKLVAVGAGAQVLGGLASMAGLLGKLKGVTTAAGETTAAVGGAGEAATGAGAAAEAGAGGFATLAGVAGIGAAVVAGVGLGVVLHNLIDDHFPSINRGLEGVGGAIYDFSVKGAEDVSNFNSSIADFVRVAWKDVSKLSDWFIGLPGTIKHFLGDAIEWLKNTGTDVVSGLWNGIVGRWDWFTGELKKLIGDIPVIGKLILKATSPSRVMADLGRDVVSGLGMGVRDNHHLVLNEVDALGKAIAGKGFDSPELKRQVRGLARISVIPEGGLPGVSGGTAAGGGHTYVYSPKLEVKGSVIAKDDLFQEFRKFAMEKGQGNGDNFFNGRSR